MKLKFNEHIIDKRGVVHLAEQTLTDNVKVYAILIDRVRFDLFDEQTAISLFKQFAESYDSWVFTVEIDY